MRSTKLCDGNAMTYGFLDPDQLVEVATRAHDHIIDGTPIVDAIRSSISGLPNSKWAFYEMRSAFDQAAKARGYDHFGQLDNSGTDEHRQKVAEEVLAYAQRVRDHRQRDQD
jgi:hypothetical protein